MIEAVADKELASRLGVLPNDTGPTWLRPALRTQARDIFESLGLPSIRMEEWRLTNTFDLNKIPLRPPADSDSPGNLRVLIHPYSLTQSPGELTAELIFVNGQFIPELSRLPHAAKGLKITTLAAALEANDPLLEENLARHIKLEGESFTALNTAALADGAFIHIARNTTIEHPIHVLFYTTTAHLSTHPRILMLLEENAHATLVETYAGPEGGSGASYFTNSVTEIVAAPSAHIDHYKLQQEGLEAFHIAALQVSLARNALFVSHSISLGAKIGRNDLNVLMGGEHAEATLNGLVLIDGDQHIDNHTLLDHAFPNCPSHELYKHVLGGSSSGVFKGKILVRPDAQKTDSKQTSKTLLLSNDAVMDSQPALEIYADDVKCTHGSTTGPVDEEMVFYFRSRGIALDAARHLLTYAFAADITRRIRVDAVRERIETIMAAKHGLPLDLRITNLGHHDEASR